MGEQRVLVVLVAMIGEDCAQRKFKTHCDQNKFLLWCQPRYRNVFIE